MNVKMMEAAPLSDVELRNNQDKITCDSIIKTYTDGNSFFSGRMFGSPLQ